MTLPLHERIRGAIEADILSGSLPPGARLPTEQALMRDYGCSRMTVSKALSALAAAGFVDRRKRAGSFVARPRLHSMVLDIPDLQAEIERRGQSYRFELVRRRVDGSMLEIDGIHHAGGSPLCVEHRQVSLTAVPEIRDVDFDTVSPGTWLLKHVPWTEADLRVAAEAATASVAARLGLPNGSACLLIERRTWRGEDTITIVRQHFSGSDYDLVARFSPSGPR